MIEWAKRLVSRGLCVLPAERRENQKRVALKEWATYQKRLPTQEEIADWFGKNQRGNAVCLVCGSVSGNLELIDFDDRASAFDAWWAAIPSDLRDLLFVEVSPSGGKHVVYRCESKVCGNKKLASRILYFDSDKWQSINGREYKPVKRKDGEPGYMVTICTIETRGEGGMFLCAPSPEYTVVQGDLSELPIITADERDTLWSVARSLSDESTQVTPAVSLVSAEPVANQGKRPGDDFSDRGDLREILLRHGWRLDRGGENESWTRPGKSSGTSGTLKGRVFYCHTSNAPPFEPGTAYSAFHVYALLEHGGDWSAASRALKRQGYGDTTPRIEPVQPASRPKAPEKIGPVPQSMLRCPGFISEVMDHTLATAPYPNVATAFAGALALQAYLAGRQVRDIADNRTNLYILGLAHSGAGKDHPRKVNTRILYEANMHHGLGERFASGEAIQDALADTPCMLFQTDEIDGLLQMIGKSRDVRHESIMSALLTLYSSANSVLPVRRKAASAGKKEEPRSIIQPHLVLLGSCIPNHYFEALSERMLTNGFFARMLVIESGERGNGQEVEYCDLPERIVETAQWWATLEACGSPDLVGRMNPRPKTVEATEEAKALLREATAQADAEYRKAEQANDPVGTTVWARVVEQARRLSLVYAVSESHLMPSISADAVNWGVGLSFHQARRMLSQASMHSASNDFHADCLKFMRLVTEAGGTITQREAMRRLRRNTKEFNVIADTLLEQGDITTDIDEKGSRKFKLL